MSTHFGETLRHDASIECSATSTARLVSFLTAGLRAALASISLVGAAAARVPAPMLGTWAHGACSGPANRLVIGADMARLGVAKPAAIYYDADDGGPHAAIHWSQEYVVDNFVYVKETNVIVHHSQGFGMPGATVYKKCRAKPNA